NKNVKILWKLAEDLDLIILYHTGCDPGPWEYLRLCDVARPRKIAKVVSQFSVPVILAHAGAYSAEKPGIWLKEAVSLANKYEQVWLDTSSVPYILHEEWIVNLFRDNSVMDKILFGSDFPVVQGLDMSRAIALVEMSPYLSDKEKLLILRENALKLLSNKI
ncbi:MAG: amidohydrolase family protein, partial [Candidatus Njordarchaeia archaeon]